VSTTSDVLEGLLRSFVRRMSNYAYMLVWMVAGPTAPPSLVASVGEWTHTSKLSWV
jgi:hypothetical protein